jgi:hypothetical protein
LRTFFCSIFETFGANPRRTLIRAPDERRARMLARSELIRTHGALRAEISENGRPLFVETLPPPEAPIS